MKHVFEWCGVRSGGWVIGAIVRVVSSPVRSASVCLRLLFCLCRCLCLCRSVSLQAHAGVGRERERRRVREREIEREREREGERESCLLYTSPSPRD
eukprot:2289835-Alexandrium_andersonii.AAC.1